MHASYRINTVAAPPRANFPRRNISRSSPSRLSRPVTSVTSATSGHLSGHVWILVTPSFYCFQKITTRLPACPGVGLETAMARFSISRGGSPGSHRSISQQVLSLPAGISPVRPLEGPVTSCWILYPHSRFPGSAWPDSPDPVSILNDWNLR